MEKTPLLSPTNPMEFSTQEISQLRQAADFVCRNYRHYEPQVLDSFWEIKKALANGLDCAELSTKKNRGITTKKSFNFIEKELKGRAENLHLKFTQGDELTHNEQLFLEKSFSLGLISLEQSSADNPRKKQPSRYQKTTIDADNTKNSFSFIFLESFSDAKNKLQLSKIPTEEERRGSLNYVIRASGINI